MTTSPRLLRALLLSTTLATFAASAAPADPTNPIDPSVPPSQINSAIASLNDLATDMLRKTNIPGLAISVVRDGQTAYAAGFGVRRVGTTAAVDADTVFQLASLSKSIGATVVAHQIQEGVVTWNTPIIKYLPGFALADDWITHHVTIADMYAHRSGLPFWSGDYLEALGYDQSQILHRLRFAKLHSFRDEYAYTDFGVTVGAEAVAAASGTDWATLSQRVIYTPLGMNATSSRFEDFIKRPNRAVGHVWVGNEYQAKYQRRPDAQSPAGGVSSSANDMARWMAMVLQGGKYNGKLIVASEALLPAITAQIISGHSSAADARPQMYGYGFGVGTLASGRMYLSHSGGFALGAATNYVLIPSLGIGITVLSNAAPIGAVEALGMDFADLVQFGVITRDWFSVFNKALETFNVCTWCSLVVKPQPPPEHPAPAKPLQDYIGTYTNAYVGDAVVTRSGDALVLSLGPDEQQHTLRHWDGDVFTYEPSGETAEPLRGKARPISKVTFTMKPRADAEALSIEFYHKIGWDRFTRR